MVFFNKKYKSEQPFVSNKDKGKSAEKKLLFERFRKPWLLVISFLLSNGFFDQISDSKKFVGPAPAPDKIGKKISPQESKIKHKSKKPKINFVMPEDFPNGREGIPIPDENSVYFYSSKDSFEMTREGIRKAIEGIDNLIAHLERVKSDAPLSDADMKFLNERTLQFANNIEMVEFLGPNWKHYRGCFFMNFRRASPEIQQEAEEILVRRSKEAISLYEEEERKGVPHKKVFWVDSDAAGWISKLEMQLKIKKGDNSDGQNRQKNASRPTFEEKESFFKQQKKN